MWQSQPFYQSDAAAIYVHFAKLHLPASMSVFLAGVNRPRINITHIFPPHANNNDSTSTKSRQVASRNYEDVLSPPFPASYVVVEIYATTEDDAWALHRVFCSRRGHNGTDADIHHDDDEGAEEDYGLYIDHFAYMTLDDLAHQKSASSSSSSSVASKEQVCGIDKSEHAVCSYDADEMNMYTRSRPVMKITVSPNHPSSQVCTGWLWGSQGHVMTNHHCIGNDYHDMDIDR